MKHVLKIDGESFADVVAINGMEGRISYMDSEESGRDVVNWEMDRPEVKRGRTMSFKSVGKVSWTRLHALALAIDKKFFDLTYLSIREGIVTKEVYATDLRYETLYVDHGMPYYANIRLEVTTRTPEALGS